MDLEVHQAILLDQFPPHPLLLFTLSFESIIFTLVLFCGYIKSVLSDNIFDFSDFSDLAIDFNCFVFACSCN